MRNDLTPELRRVAAAEPLAELFHYLTDQPKEWESGAPHIRLAAGRTTAHAYETQDLQRRDCAVVELRSDTVWFTATGHYGDEAAGIREWTEASLHYLDRYSGRYYIFTGVLSHDDRFIPLSASRTTGTFITAFPSELGGYAWAGREATGAEAETQRMLDSAQSAMAASVDMLLGVQGQPRAAA